MNNKLLFAFLISLIIFSVNVSAYSVTIGPPEVKISNVYSTNLIQTNGDLKTNFWMFFNIPKNTTLETDNITIYFDPFENRDSEPIKYTEIILCNAPNNGGLNFYTWGYTDACNETYTYSIFNYTWERSFLSNGQVHLKNYTLYRITFTPKKSNKWQKFMFRIMYTTPNFINKQGDYYVALLTYPNMNNKNYEIKNTLVLPTKDDVPKFIPDADDIQRVFYGDDGNTFTRWAFIFNNADEKIIWYSNEKEIKDNEENLQSKYMGLGVLFGFIISIVLLFLNKWINCIPCHKFNRNKIIVSINCKKYHHRTCTHINNISSKNMKQFKNKKDAEKEGYTACKLCN